MKKKIAYLVTNAAIGYGVYKVVDVTLPRKMQESPTYVRLVVLAAVAVGMALLDPVLERKFDITD